MTERRSITSPMAMVDLRAQIENCNPGWCKILAAFNLKSWNGKKRITAKEIAAYSGLAMDRVNDLTKGMVAKGWLARKRTPNGYIYEKLIKEMTWDEAHEIGRLRLTGHAQQPDLFKK